MQPFGAEIAPIRVMECEPYGMSLPAKTGRARCPRSIGAPRGTKHQTRLFGQSRYFHDGHRAVDDCFALLELPAILQVIVPGLPWAVNLARGLVTPEATSPAGSSRLRFNSRPGRSLGTERGRSPYLSGSQRQMSRPHRHWSAGSPADTSPCCRGQGCDRGIDIGRQRNL